jgi:hypothetical protein
MLAGHQLSWPLNVRTREDILPCRPTCQGRQPTARRAFALEPARAASCAGSNVQSPEAFGLREGDLAFLSRNERAPVEIDRHRSPRSASCWLGDGVMCRRPSTVRALASRSGHASARAGRAGTSRATGRPRRVISRDSPFSTRSRIARISRCSSRTDTALMSLHDARQHGPGHARSVLRRGTHFSTQRRRTRVHPKEVLPI